MAAAVQVVPVSWKGYGGPNHPATPSRRQMRLMFDNASHGERELKFAKWCGDTVYPAAVKRWIREIGEKVK